ncbi:MAG: hypothetical protein LUP94_00830, partial [Candidatus Methanomethylicus sp.]|nr:hypothetical protein [Candidatus Methanomethylicus sp.]
PGTAVLGNNIVFALDPYTGRGSLPSPHSMLGSNVVTSIWQDVYGLPVGQYMGTFAAQLDEMAFNLMASTIFQYLSGSDLMFLQFADAALDPAMIVVAAELAHFGRHFSNNFDQILPTKENLALGLQKEFGPTGEGWMTTDFNMAKIESFYKTISLDTRGFDVWLKEGAQLWTHDLCREKLKEYEQHEPAPLPQDMKERMDAIVKEGTDLLKRQDGGAPTHSAKPL